MATILYHTKKDTDEVEISLNYQVSLDAQSQNIIDNITNDLQEQYGDEAQDHIAKIKNIFQQLPVSDNTYTIQTDDDGIQVNFYKLETDTVGFPFLEGFIYNFDNNNLFKLVLQTTSFSNIEIEDADAAINMEYIPVFVKEHK